MPRYVEFSMPRAEADGFVREMGNMSRMHYPFTRKLVERLRLATEGKDRRTANRFPKVKRPRVELDLRRKAS